MESVSSVSGGMGLAWSSTASTSSSPAHPVGPYFGARIINDAVDTMMAALQAAVDSGLGTKVDTRA